MFCIASRTVILLSVFVLVSSCLVLGHTVYALTDHDLRPLTKIGSMNHGATDILESGIFSVPAEAKQPSTMKRYLIFGH